MIDRHGKLSFVAMKKSGFFVLPGLMATILVGCLETESDSKIENLEDKLDGQSFDLNRAKKYLAEEQEKLEKSLQAQKDIELSAKIEEELAGKSKELEEATNRNDELAGSIDLLEEEFRKYRAQYRAHIRKNAIGQTIDLSATKGEAYKDVRVLTITPLEIKIYMPSGPEQVPLKDLTPEVLEKLQMSEEEATEYTEKLRANAKLRAEKYKKWKEGLAERKEAERKKEILQKMKDMQAEIFEREDVIRIKIGQIKGWKSKASQWEANASKENNEARRDKAMRYAEVYRDKAQELADENSDSYIVISRLKIELEDLKRLGIR